jgi:hypothetical protein
LTPTSAKLTICHNTKQNNQKIHATLSALDKDV